MSRLGASRVRVVLGLLLTAVAVVGLLIGQGAGPAHATGSVTLTGHGADSCTAPSVSQMQTYWNDSPYSYWPIYIGGADRACSQPNLTSSWVTAVLKQGWSLLPLWVGLQNPCKSGQSAYFSSNTSTAYDQGSDEAHSAYEAWLKLSSNTNFPIAFDMEAPSTNSSSCRAAAKSFINGWDYRLHQSPAQTAGVYTSSCAGDIDDFSSIANKPDFVYAADYNGVESVNDVACLSTSHWDRNQRHKQYQGGHNVTYGGVTLNVDSDCANGPVFGNTSRSPYAGCNGSSSSSQAAIRDAERTDRPVPFDGSAWSAGGPLDSQLLRNGTPVQLAGLTTKRVEVAPTAATVAPPMVLSDGSLLVAVTTHGRRSRELLYTTTDGRHFTRRTAISLPAALNPGVGPVMSTQPRSRVLVMVPNSTVAYRWAAATGAVSRLSTKGLPGAVSSLRFTGARDGTATVESMDLSDHSPVSSLVRTHDGGRTWH